MVGRLRLSRSESVASLIRGVLLRAASSSPGALLGFLERYRRLLLHARDAFHAGQTVDRARLRQFTAELGDQLVWWELFPVESGASELELSDLDALADVIPAARSRLRAGDPKLDRLHELLAEEPPTLVFTVSRDTVHYIRHRLPDICLAWCTGERAGVGAARLPREIVLQAFRDGSLAQGPRHLLVTDVAAEGLDLQRAARIVHYDLPWTPMRLEQREGRSVRLGSAYQTVEVVRFAPHPELDRIVRLEAALTRKARLPATAGLGPSGRRIWRWRTDVARDFGVVDGVAGVARVASCHSGVLVGVSLHEGWNSPRHLYAIAGWLRPDGTWMEDAELITERLRLAAGCQVDAASPEESRVYLELLTPVLRRKVELARGARWISPHPTVASRAAAARLSALIQGAARLRDEQRLAELERAMRFVGGGHTAGEEMMLERLSGMSDNELTSALSRTLPQPDFDAVEVRLTGFIIFGPAEARTGFPLVHRHGTRSEPDPEPGGEAPRRKSPPAADA